MTTEPFRVGILGAGEQADESRGPRLLDLSVPENVELVAVADMNVGAAHTFAGKFRVPNVYSTLGEMLADAGLHGLINTTPHSAHASTTIEALEAGAHVLCEKPMATSVAEARRMLEVAQRTERVLAIGYQLPYMVEDLRALVEAGWIGDVLGVRAKWVRRFGVPDREAFWSDPEHGGVAVDLLGHLLSAALPMVPGRPLSIEAQKSNRFGVARYGERFRAEDTFAATVGFEGGARGEFTVAWAADVPEREEIVVWVDGTEAAMRIVLPAYELTAEGFEAVIYRRRMVGGLEVIADEVIRHPLPRPTEDCFLVQNLNWIQAARGLEQLRYGPELAITIQEIVERGHQAARSGETVPL
jgi:predicted dehydrogenase